MNKQETMNNKNIESILTEQVFELNDIMNDLSLIHI